MRWTSVKTSYRFALFSGMGVVASKLIYETDTIVIGFALGTTFVVPYAIGLRLCDMLRAPIGQIGEVFLPRAGELQETARHSELRSLVSKGMGVAFLLSAGFFIGAWYFGGLLIEAWMPKPYPQSHMIFAILVGAQMIALPVSILHMVLVGMGEVRVPSLLRLSAAIVNLILSLILVRSLGIVGVALGTLIPILLLDLCALLPYGARRIGMPLRSLLNEVVGKQLPPLAALLGYSHFVGGLPLRPEWSVLILVTAGGGCVLGLVWGAQWLLTRRRSMESLAA